MLFKDMLREEMIHQGLNSESLAKKAGIRRYKVEDYLQGEVPKGDSLNKICEVLDIDQDDIVYDSLNISVAEAARIMQKQPTFVKSMVRKGIFGYCEGKNFHIPRLKFEQYMGMRKEWQPDEITKALVMYIAETVKCSQNKNMKRLS